MVPVERAELFTQDMELISGALRAQYVEHSPGFHCPDLSLVDGVVRSATVGGLHAGLVRYGGFVFSAMTDPAQWPVAMVCRGGAAVITTAREDLRLIRGDVAMIPSYLPCAAMGDDSEFTTLGVPWPAVRSLAETRIGVPAAGLWFEAAAPVSAAAQRAWARTAELVRAQLVTSAVAEIYPLVVAEMTRLVAMVFLETFPNTTMTVSHQPGPGWVAPAVVQRAVTYIEANAHQPVTVDQIAAAAGVGSRALQNAFRRYFGMTPTGYLRGSASSGPIRSLVPPTRPAA
jgi:Bacterial regulatory helix-turn-helix proteins, AraC family/AraC-binding-like domain